MRNVCLLCYSENLQKIMHFTNAPRNIQSLLDKEQLSMDKKISLELVKCNSCNLVQLGNVEVVPTDYYDDYVMGTSFSTQMIEYTHTLAKNLVDTYHLQDKIIMELGCGDGFFLQQFKNLGTQVLGIEPSKRFSMYAKDEEIQILNIYFNLEAQLPQKEFDAIVSRQVFEHLKNPNEILQAMFKFLKTDGIGLIEVPSFEKALRLNRYYDIFSDHIAYYTKETLSHLVLRNNFEILDIFDAFNDEYIVIIFRKKQDLSIMNFVDGFQSYKKDFVNKIHELKSKGKKIVMWGAGGKGNALLSFCDIDSNHIDFIIDSDDKKIGKYTIGSHILIRDPSILKKEKVDVIIISAMAYESEILKQLAGMTFQGEIYVISPELRMIKG